VCGCLCLFMCVCFFRDLRPSDRRRPGKAQRKEQVGMKCVCVCVCVYGLVPGSFPQTWVIISQARVSFSDDFHPLLCALWKHCLKKKCLNQSIFLHKIDICWSLGIIIWNVTDLFRIPLNN